MGSGNINLNRPVKERAEISQRYKFFKVAHLHDLEQMHGNGEISYSRMAELINELAYDFYVKKPPTPKIPRPATAG